jgi:hypothetical protein
LRARGLRASVAATCALKPKSSARGGPTHRRKIANAMAAGGLPSEAAPTTRALASAPGALCLRLGRRQDGGQ